MPKSYLTTEDKELRRIYDRIAGERRSSRKSQREMGNALGITGRAYGIKERDHNFTLKDFLIVCHGLGIDPAEIMTEACR